MRSDSTVAQLHQALPVAFGWEDEHLNRFEIRGREYAAYRDGGGMMGIDASFGYALATQKRKEFAHESEARIVAWRAETTGDPWKTPGPASVKLSWVPEELIEKIVIKPILRSGTQIPSARSWRGSLRA